MNISEFMVWFLNQFINIGAFMLGKLNQITIYNNVSLLDFIIAITIVGMFLSIVLTIPKNVNRYTSRSERNKKERKEDNDNE